MRATLRGLLVGALLMGAPGAAQAVSDMELLLDTLVEKGVLTDLEAGNIRREITAQKPAQTKELAKEIVPKWAQSITFSGDLRLRQESFKRDPVEQSTSTTSPSSNSTETRHRQRARLRLGAKATVTDQLEAGLRLATGTNLDPIGTNQSFQDTFDKKDIFVDQMYLKYTTAGGPLEAVPATIVGGKFENPFYATPMLWDGDLTFEGGVWTVNPAVGPVSLFATSGAFPLDELSTNGGDPMLWGNQIGASWNIAPDATEEWLKNLSVKGAVGYYDFANMENTVDTFTNTLGNTGVYSGGTAPNFTAFRPTYDFDEVDLLGEVTSQVMGQPVKLYWDYVKNTAVADNDEGFHIGGKVGKADKPLAWEGGYYYQRLEPDAVFGLFADSDFGEGGTNRSGHVYYAALGTLRNSTIGFKWLVTEQLTGPDRSIDRVQVDWVTKF